MNSLYRLPIATAAALALTALLATGSARASDAAGAAILAVGQVTDTATDGSSRTLHDGDAVYSGDSLSTGAGSYADLNFADGGRILLRPNTEFQIESFHYTPPPAAEAPATAAAETHESAFFRLLKGGLRAISGLVGHVTRSDYRLDTPIATIGIRGTEYEVRYCNSDCGDEADRSGLPQNGIYTAVDRGAIALNNQSSEMITTAGQYMYVRDAHAPIVLLKHRPGALRHMQLPERYRKLEMEMHKRRVEDRRTRLRRRAELRHRLRHPGA